MIYTANYVGVILAAALNFIIGFLWHGPIFGKVWVKLMGFTQAQMDEGMKKGMAKPMIMNAIANIITAFVFFTIAQTLMVSTAGAFGLALLAWLGFSMPIYLNDTLWGGKSWGLFWFSSVYYLVSLLVCALVFGFFN